MILSTRDWIIQCRVHATHSPKSPTLEPLAFAFKILKHKRIIISRQDRGHFETNAARKWNKTKRSDRPKRAVDFSFCALYEYARTPNENFHWKYIGCFGRISISGRVVFSQSMQGKIKFGKNEMKKRVRGYDRRLTRVFQLDKLLWSFSVFIFWSLFW